MLVAMWLTVCTGTSSGKSVRLAPGSYNIGRDAGCELVLDDRFVSDVHARLNVDPEGRVEVEDLGSTNGTMLGGSPLTAVARLQNNEEFRLGETVLRLSTEESRGGTAVLPALETGIPRPAQRDAPVVTGSGAVAEGNVKLEGHIAAGRDVVYHEGFRLRTRMRDSARNALRLGALLFVLGYAVVTVGAVLVGNELSKGATRVNSFTDLPNWEVVVVGAALVYGGLFLAVISLFVPRITVEERRVR